MITIDGTVYQVPILSLRRKAEFLDRYAQRTEDGTLHREIIGVYFNYELRFGRPPIKTEYARLWDKLTEPTEFHSVVVPDSEGDFTFAAYFSGVSDELLRQRGQEYYWKELTVNFIAQIPARK